MCAALSLMQTPESEADAIAARLRPTCQRLAPLEEEQAFAAAFDGFADARVLLLGEATHGTAEFYRARAIITRHFIEKHGFHLVALEADWPDATLIDRYVRHRQKPSGAHDAFQRFPTWMWRNREFRTFIDQLHEDNRDKTFRERAEVRGLDVYSLRASIAAILGYLNRTDPQAAAKARRRYACLTPWQHDPSWYGRVVLRGEADPCEDVVVAQLREMLQQRIEDAEDDREDQFEAIQNARVVRAAEQYYRLMYRGARESWNLRDRHMFDTLRHLMSHRGGHAKAIVWAHNSHVGNAAATAMGWQGEFNIGELCRTAFGDQAVLIGFSTDRGTVAAADDWDQPVRIMDIVPSRPDSYERVCRAVGLPRFLLDLRRATGHDAHKALMTPRLERAIGVVYRPDTERQSHYFEAVLPEQFDAFVWIDETKAVSPLAAHIRPGVPDTFPFGL